MWELKRIGVVSLAKVYGIISAIIGFVIGLCITIGALIFGAALSAAPLATDPSLAFLPVAIGLFSIILTPIMMGIAGFIMGAVTAILYNWVASWAGGVELDFHRRGSFLNRIPRPRRKRRK